MRKRYRVLILAALVAALVVPVGYALSVESTPAQRARHAGVPAAAAASVPATAAAAIAAPIVVRSGARTSPFYQVPDAAKLFAIGTVLFGLAAAVRKAI